MLLCDWHISEPLNWTSELCDWRVESFEEIGYHNSFFFNPRDLTFTPLKLLGDFINVTGNI